MESMEDGNATDAVIEGVEANTPSSFSDDFGEPSDEYPVDSAVSITVKEIKEINELLRENPTFIAFTDADIDNGIQGLVAPIRAEREKYDNPGELFLQLYNNVVKTKKSTNVDRPYYYEDTNIARKDNSDFKALIEPYTETLKAPYKTRYSVLNSTLPFVNDITVNDSIINGKLQVIIGTDPFDFITVHDGDKLELKRDVIIKLNTPNLKKLYIDERINSSDSYTQLDSIPTLTKVESIQRIPSQHELDIYFEGDSLNTEEYNKLCDILKRLAIKYSGRQPNVKKRDYKQVVRPEYWAGQKRLLQTLLKEGWISKIPEPKPVYDLAYDFEKPSKLPVDSETELVYGLVNGSIELTDIISILQKFKEARLKQEKFDIYKGINEFNPEKLEIFVKWVEDWFFVGNYNEVIRPIIKTYTDNSEITADEQYEDKEVLIGDPFNNDDEFANVEQGEVFWAFDKTVFGVKKVDTITIDDIIPKSFELTQGIKEVITVIAKNLNDIVNLSGIPFDPTIIDLQSISRLSRLEQIKERFPDIDDAIIINRLNGGLPTTILPSGFETVLNSVKSEFNTYISELTITTIANLVLLTQRQLLNKVLLFDPNSAYRPALSLWSVGGPPINSSKKGVIYYISEVLETIVKNDTYGVWQTLFTDWTATMFEKSISKSFNQETVTELIKLYENNDKLEKAQDKTYLAEQAFVDAIGLFKQQPNPRIFIKPYIKLMLLLPGRVTKNAQTKNNVGCCLEPVSSTTLTNIKKPIYTAEMDKLKINFAKNRNRPRQTLFPTSLKPPPNYSSKIDKKDPAPIKVTNELTVNLFDYREWFKLFKQIVPIDDYNKIDLNVQESTKRGNDILSKLGKSVNLNKIKTYFENESDITELIAIIEFIPSIFISILKDKREDGEITYLQTVINKITLIKKLLKLDTAITDSAEPNLKRLIIYLAICCIKLPDGNNTVADSFITTTQTLVLDKIVKKIKVRHVPTELEIQNSVNEIREKNKVELIRKLNRITDDGERAVFNQLKTITGNDQTYLEGRDGGHIDDIPEEGPDAWDERDKGTPENPPELDEAIGDVDAGVVIGDIEDEEVD